MKKEKMIYDQLLMLDASVDHLASELFEKMKVSNKKITKAEVEGFVQRLIVRVIFVQQGRFLILMKSSSCQYRS